MSGVFWYEAKRSIYVCVCLVLVMVGAKDQLVAGWPVKMAEVAREEA